jgi:hypothetical protein
MPPSETSSGFPPSFTQGDRVVDLTMCGAHVWGPCMGSGTVSKAKRWWGLNPTKDFYRKIIVIMLGAGMKLALCLYPVCGV